MRAYRIVEWNERYEVDVNGRAAKAGMPVEKLRKGPLAYFREPVFGRRPGPSARRAMRMGVETIGNGGDVLVFGLWLKLQEVASQERAGLRGWILDERSQPVDLKRFAEMVGFQFGQHLEEAMQILMHTEVAWVEHVEFCGKVRKGAERCGKPHQGAEAFKRSEQRSAAQPISEQISATESKDSDSQGSACSVSDSLDEAMRNARVDATLELRVGVGQRRDMKVLADIFGQLLEQARRGEVGEGIFADAVIAAKDCRTARKPIAMFIEIMKEPKFGYVPQGRRLLPRRAT